MKFILGFLSTTEWAECGGGEVLPLPSPTPPRHTHTVNLLLCMTCKATPTPLSSLV